MNKSFTLIEILVVIVIVGILSAFIIVSMAGVSSKATIAKGQAFSSSLKNSLMMNLVSEWKMDGNADDAWGSNNGTLVGPTHLPVAKSGSDCVSGGCYQFDGTEDYINVNNNSILTNMSGLTVSAWIKGNIRVNHAGIVSKWAWHSQQDYVFKLQADGDATHLGVFGFGVAEDNLDDTASINSNTNLSINKWYYLVGTFKSNSFIKVYTNGQLDGSNDSATVAKITGNSNSLSIGKYASYFFNGFIDDVRLYNAAIPSSQIQENYYSGLNNLLVRGGFDAVEYGQRLAELKSNSANNE